MISKLKQIRGLNVDQAIQSVGGLTDVYEQTVKMTARKMPETIKKMDKYIASKNSKEFAIEIHGINGVLRNIGALTLGIKAAKLENAAKSGDMDYCISEYPAYKEALMKFSDELNKATSITGARKPMNQRMLASALETAKAALDGYDAMGAQDAIRPLLAYSHSDKADALMEKLVASLDEFNFQNAMSHIKQLEKMI